MKIVAFVPAKGYSERIKNKNLSILDGEYLFKRKLRQLLECARIDEVYLDTDSKELISLVDDLPVKILERPVELASNQTDGHELFAYECSQVAADVYIQVLCTAPFVGAATIDRALSCFLESGAESLVAIRREKQYVWKNGVPDYGWGRIPNSVDLPSMDIEAMSLYMVRRGDAPVIRRFTASPYFFELSPEESVDVNWPADLLLAESISAGRRAQENLSMQALKPYLSSAMLSDITREMDMQCSLPEHLQSNIRRKIFGRAKTMLLDQCRPGERWENIYDALDSYDFVRPGDIVVVDNMVPGCAYFGGLNAGLAARAGAGGAVINGLTRDAEAVGALDFPVFARGFYCSDIKYRGVVRSMNKPLHIEGVDVANGDYIFGDVDGVVVIPQRHWSAVQAAVMSGIDKEWRVGRAVAMGMPAKDILRSIGEF